MKEILKRFEEVNTNSLCPFEMEASDCKKLLNYIKNLQTIEQQYSAILSENAELEEENKRVSDLYETYEEANELWIKKCENYKSRIDKAIEEYTKTYRTVYYTMKYYRDSKQIEKCDILYNDCIKKLDELDLLNILKESDE